MVIVGRDAELTELGALAEQALQGRGALILVTGEAGIGKTTLCAQAAARSSLHTAWAGCMDPAPAYSPWRQLLAQIAPAEHQVLNAADRKSQFEAVTEVLRQSAAATALHLTIDDLHAADAGSLRLLEFVAAQVRSMPVLIAATSRDGISPQLRPHAQVLRLAGLSRDNLGEFIARSTGLTLPPAAVDSVARHTAGNPLFARELVALLGEATSAQLAGPAPAPVPESVRAVLSHRLDQLSKPCQETIAVAAVIGEQPSLDVLQAVLGRPREQVLAMLDEAVTARVLRNDLTFTHPLIRSTAYASIGLVQRIKLHQHIAESLSDPEALAYHFLAAAPGGTAEPAYRAAMTAAAESLRLFAYEQAAMHYGQALAAVTVDPSAGDRAEALLGLGQAQAAAGEVAESRKAFLEAAGLARKTANTLQLAQAALGLAPGNGFEVTLFDREQIALLEEAASTLDRRANPGLYATVSARLSVALSLSDVKERRDVLSEEAIAAARESGDPKALAYALAAHCDDIAGPDDTETRLAESEEVIKLAGGDLHTELLGRRLRLVALLELGELEAAEREAAEFASTARLLRQSTYDWYPPLWQGMRALRQGSYEECRQRIADVRRIGVTSANAQLLASVQELYLAVETGRPQDAVAIIETAEVAVLGVQVRIGLAYFLALAGNLAEAAAQLPKVIELPKDSEWLSAMVQVAQTAQLLGDREKAAWAAEQLLPYRERYVVEGIGAVVRGRVAQFIDPAPEQAGRNVFRREGDFWVLAFAGKSVRLRHAKGLADIALLLARPGREIPALDLAVPAAAVRGSAGEELFAPGDLGDVLDAQAREAYKRRLAELQDADDDRSRAEREALIEQLTAAYGLAGRPRKAGDPGERARTAVTARIRAALDRIAEVHPDLGRHLRHSVHTGTMCRYEPEVPATWQL